MGWSGVGVLIEAGDPLFHVVDYRVVCSVDGELSVVVCSCGLIAGVWLMVVASDDYFCVVIFVTKIGGNTKKWFFNVLMGQ